MRYNIIRIIVSGESNMNVTIETELKHIDKRLLKIETNLLDPSGDSLVLMHEKSNLDGYSACQYKIEKQQALKLANAILDYYKTK